jgi:hypothetical protein
MASTYTLISSQVLASSAASVTFSSIPATYTDLVLRVSARTDRASNSADTLKIVFNSDTTTIYSKTDLTGNGAVANTQRVGPIAYTYFLYMNATTSTGSTFGSVEIYLPSYLSSTSKQISMIGAQEDNSSTAFMAATASLFANSSAISRIDLTSNTSSNFVQYSSFYLYGISSS